MGTIFTNVNQLALSDPTNFQFLQIHFKDLSNEKQNNQRLVQIQTELEKSIQQQNTTSKQYIECNELDGMNERLRNYEIEISQLQKDCLSIKSISENELEDERTKLCKLNLKF